MRPWSWVRMEAHTGVCSHDARSYWTAAERAAPGERSRRQASRAMTPHQQGRIPPLDLMGHGSHAA
eukprot:3122359-Amphidinium_carterae.1